MTNAEARFNKSLCPRKPEGSLGRTAKDVHLDSHTAHELCGPFDDKSDLLTTELSPLHNKHHYPQVSCAVACSSFGQLNLAASCMWCSTRMCFRAALIFYINDLPLHILSGRCDMLAADTTMVSGSNNILPSTRHSSPQKR